MRPLWRIAIAAVSVVILLAVVFTWRSIRSRAAARELGNEVQLTLAHAQRGDAEAEERLGGMYFYGRGEPQSYEDALRWYRAAAIQGNARAEYDLGFLYDTGKGIEQDFAEALRWYQAAAVQGDRQAQCGLAAMYYKGRGVPQDYATAALLYRRSADQGLARAQYDLGYMYYHGQGVSEDLTEGRLWIKKAAKQGDEQAKEAVGMKLTPWIMASLALQALVGFVLVSRPLSFNIWEPNEGTHNSGDWLSIGTGALFLLNMGLGWYGYTHNLIWYPNYGFTGFKLVRWSLNAITPALLYFVWFKKKSSAFDLLQKEP